MANVSHASLTGSNLHEPKGVATAVAGTVYTADGAGSGSWVTVGGGAPSGTISDFATPIAPAGWIECAGQTLNAAAFPTLWAALTVQMNGTKTLGLATITGLAHTSHFIPGYKIAGNGIPSGAVIQSVDGPTQITMDVPASASGTHNVIFSPWNINSTQFQLPDLVSLGRYRRSRHSGFGIGATHTSANLSHNHGWTSGVTSSDGSHTHTVNITDPGHFHSPASGGGGFWVSGGGGFQVAGGAGTSAVNTNTVGTGISASTVSNGAHTHTVTGSNIAEGGSETRVTTVVFMTCIKI